MSSNLSRNSVNGFYSNTSSPSRRELNGAIETAVKFVSSPALRGNKKAQEFTQWVKQSQAEYARDGESWMDAWDTKGVQDMIKGIRQELMTHDGAVVADGLEASLTGYKMETSNYTAPRSMSQTKEDPMDFRNNVSTSKVSSNFASQENKDSFTGERTVSHSVSISE